MTTDATGGEAQGEQKGFDVFLSHGSEDKPWVRTLAENLERLGVRVFLDEWEILPGDVLVHELDEGILRSRSGVLVCSPTAMAKPWVRIEYAAMMGRAIEGRQRLVPVLYREVELPPLLAARLWVDFRGADGEEYLGRVQQLAGVLRGERPERPSVGGKLEMPPGTGYRAEGALRRTLRIGVEEVALLEAGQVVARHRPSGLAHRDEERLWELERARRRGSHAPREVKASQEPGESRLQAALLEVGAGLGRAYLAGEAGVALGEAVEEAERSNAALELGLEVVEELTELPWETLRLVRADGELDAPLVLHPRVRMFRGVDGLGSTPAIKVRGPLRVLVAIGSPESDDRRGELLDYEAELSQILDAVEAARASGRAHVRVLNRGTVAAIREALEAERFHVLHISCHAKPGRLFLEDERGGADLVDVKRFAAEVLPEGRGVPLVVLSGCTTALTGQRAEEGEGALPALGRGLLAQGVPAVLAMNATVSDTYATRLAAHLYHTLATAERPEVLEALSWTRRRLETVRRQEPAESPQRELAEWATPVLLRRAADSQPLYDAAEGFDEVKQVVEPELEQVGMVVRAVGEFVGRRREQRLLLGALQRGRAGVVVHGLGGAGKSTLAAELVKALAGETDLVVAIAGQTSVDQLLDTVGQCLFAHCIERRLDEKHPYRELAQVLRNPQLEWRQRLGLLGRLLLGRERVLLLLDNFEDNLGVGDGSRRVADPELASLLASWVGSPRRSRLVVTSRYPFQLPESREGRLERLHLGPLSLAETRKLMWRLEGLSALSLEEQQRAYADVGGHPRTLEYLDALLRGGRARFDDVAERMEKALEARGVKQPRAWMAGTKGDLDRALAEAVTLAVDDVLLGQLLERLEAIPGARRLLLGASVYRQPVDEIGLRWQAGEELEVEPDPGREERQARLEQARTAAAAEGRSTRLEELGLEPELVAQIEENWRQARRPPLEVPEGFREALEALQELGLVAPLEPAEEGEERSYAVHRWTAGALAGMSETGELAAAHRRAASYWRWRVRVWPQSREQDVEQLVEARHHLHAAGEMAEAVAVTDAVVEQLHTWGAYGWEERLCLETLGWLPERSLEAAGYQHQLGMVAQLRGDYDAALDWHRRSLAIDEELGDRAGMASGYHQLGGVAQERGDYDAALDWYRRSLAIDEELGNRAGMASGYHNLGAVAQERGDYDAALDWYRRCQRARKTDHT